MSADGGTSWEAVASYNGENHTIWETATIELPQLDGVATARIRFRLETDGSLTFDGWHVDDILVRAGGGGSASCAAQRRLRVRRHQRVVGHGALERG